MKVLSFGSLNLDKVYSVSHFIRPGETMAAIKLEEFCGGKGLNQSIALAKAGAQVWHAGSVGEADGKVLLDALQESGADISLVRRLSCPTGHAIIQVNAEGQNCILLYGGANQQITREQVDETLSHFEAGDFLVLQNEISQLDYIMEQAGKKGMVIVFNPSPMTPELLKLPLQYVSYFLLNEVEARDLCGESVAEEAYPEKLLEQYPDAHIVLTLGARGSIYQDSTLRIEQPAYRVKAVDTTAAGDTFTGYFVAAVAAGTEVKQALDEAAKASAIAVSRHGAAPSIPLREEVLKASF